ncbi:MAG: DEAD/DEAH box helicase [Blautia faecis]|mgnify:FL=1|nr:DEAD/DEAH box helicase [Blautia faecis]
MELRPYQKEAKEAIFEQWDSGVLKTLLVLPTGCGKTVVFAKVTEECVRKGDRVLILAHRGELLDQAADKLMKTTGLGCALEKAESSCQGSWFRVVVGSVQTLMREKRLGSFPADYFNTIIIDEAHHCISDSYQRVLQHFPEAQVLGVTATPDRGDMRNLGVYFESLAYEYTLPKAIKEGYLSPIKALTIPLKIDMSNVSVQAGDFKASEIGTALDPYLEGIAQEMQKYCMDKKTVVFLPLVKTSQKFRDLLNAYGFQAAEVNGDSQDRAEVLKDFDAGKYNVLCNSMLLTEGWDCPSVDCIVVLRPTKVRSLYCQMVGRGTRLSPETGKDHLLLLDFLWHTERHELCHPASLICENEEVAQKMTENLEQEAGIVVDIEEAEKTASEDVVAQREEALAKQLSEMKKRKGRLVDPLQFEMSIQAEDLSNYVPSFGWEMGPPSDKQKHTLEKLGIMPDQIENAGKAAKILDRLDKRKNEGLTTPKQIRYLESKGFQHVGTWQFDTAKNLIDRIAGNGWKIPNDIVPQEYKGA